MNAQTSLMDSHLQSLRVYPRLWCRTGLGAVLTICISCDAFAGISTDNSLGRPAQTLTGPNYLIPETLGRLSGSNLFHSFQTFNILTGESANFTTATSGIANVISRVTGGSLSQINGQLSLTPCTGCGAPNFFFINPAGVTFGAGASIDVPGAFHVSTADYIKFPDGNYYADTTKASTFSSAPPEAFGFLGTTRASVTVNDGAILSTQPLQPISIVGGDIEINNGTVSTQGGDIRVVALGQRAQEVGFTGILPAAHGDISILNGGQINSPTFGEINGGGIAVSTGNLNIDGQTSRLSSRAEAGSTGNSGNTDVLVTGNLSLTNDGYISSSTLGSGNGGNVQVAADNIAIAGNTSGIYASTYGSGHAGNALVTATGNLSITNTGAISSSTSSSGDAGSVKVNADSIVINGQGSNLFTGIASDAVLGSTGNAGTVEVAAIGNLSIINAGVIASNTFSSGDAGSVKVNTGSIAINGQGSNLFTGIASDAENASIGHAGNVEVTATGNLSISNGGRISSFARSSGNAGSVKVGADIIFIDGQGAPWTGIFSDALTGSTGDAGNLEVTAIGNLSITNGGRISSRTSDSGNSGSVKVGADSIFIDGQGKADTGIFSEANGDTGSSGNVEVTAAGNLSILNKASISSDTQSTGSAGSTKVRANNIIVNHGWISSDTWYSGDAGSVEVLAYGSLSISNSGGINSDTWNAGNAGSVKVRAGNIVIDTNGNISSDANVTSTGNAGHVEVYTLGTLSLASGGVISSSALESGNAGDVNVGAGTLIIDGNSYISSDGIGSGNAGNVEVSVAGRLSITNGGEISSKTQDSGKAGTVTVSASTLFVDGALSDGTSSSINASADAGSSGQTGNVSVRAIDCITLSNGGELAIRNNATVAASYLLTPTSINVTAPRITILNSPNAITTSSTGNVAAGSINITASDKLYLDPSGITTAAADGNGGAIDITAGVIGLDNSQIATSVTGRTGNGGNIAINANTLILNTGFILANTAAANAAGGTVSIATQNLIPSGNTLFLGGNMPYTYQPGVFGFNVIQAAAPTGVSGTVHTTSPVLDISGSLTGLNTQVIDTGGLGRSPCQVSGGSSLAQSGRGGLPPSARGLLRAELPLLSTISGNYLPVSGSDMRLVSSNWGCS